MLKHRANLQAGVSLVELMIGSAVGLIVIAATVATYVAIARSGSEILSSAKLNAELRAAALLRCHFEFGSTPASNLAVETWG